MIEIPMKSSLSIRVTVLLILGLLGITVSGAGCYPSWWNAPPEEVAVPAREDFRPAAEERFQAFIDALDRGDRRAVRSMLSVKQPDPELINALSRQDMREIAAWLRTYEFGGIWDDRVEFRPTQHPPGEAVTSLYVHFTPGKVGITH